MKNIVSVINSLPDLLPLKPASEILISDAEIELRVSFAEEYKLYLSNFGAIIADGIELTGISKSEHRSVIALTKREWSLNPKVAHSMYVVENAGVDGIIIWQDKTGSIYQSSPNSEPKVIAKSLAEYLLNRSK